MENEPFKEREKDQAEQRREVTCPDASRWEGKMSIYHCEDKEVALIGTVVAERQKQERLKGAEEWADGYR